jgi:carboxyl-terminal processing protease
MTGEMEEITITRALIEVHSIKGLKRDDKDQWVYWIDPDKKIAYIRITTFTEASAADLRKALEPLVKDGMKGLVLDLRFNPGGILKTAVEVCDMFIDKGVIVSTRGRTAPNWEATATRDGTLPFFPMVILINPFSASASEIVSGCLQDHHRAIILGERSFGKGSVQNVIYLEGEKAALKLTTSKYYMPSGRSIHRDEDMKETDEWGVMPDIAVPMTPEDYIGILRARMDAEVIHRGVNDAKPDGAKPDASKAGPAKPDATKPDKPKADAPKADKPKAEAPKPDKPRPEGPAMPDLEEGAPGDAAAAKPAKPGEDKQLQRAIDVLRSMDVIEKYLKKEPVKAEQPKPAEAKKAA